MTKSLYDPSYIEMIARLRTIRESRGISQREIANQIGKPQSFISKVETCERRLDLIEVLRLCEAMEVQLEEIIPSNLKHLL